jgi:hypothetical protein
MADAMDKLLGSGQSPAAADLITELLDDEEAPRGYENILEFLPRNPRKKGQAATFEFVDAWGSTLLASTSRLAAQSAAIREDIAELPGCGTAVLSVVAVGVSVLSALAVHRHLSRIERRLAAPPPARQTAARVDRPGAVPPTGPRRST